MSLLPAVANGTTASEGAIDFAAVPRAAAAVAMHAGIARVDEPERRRLIIAAAPLAPNTLVLVERPLAAVCDLESSTQLDAADVAAGDTPAAEAAQAADGGAVPDDMLAAAGGEPVVPTDRVLRHVLRQPGVVHASEAPAGLRTHAGRLTWALLARARRPPTEPDGSPTPAADVGRPLDAAYFARWFAGASFADGRVVHQWEQFFSLEPDNKLDAAHRADLRLIFRLIVGGLRPPTPPTTPREEDNDDADDLVAAVMGEVQAAAAAGGADAALGRVPARLCDVYAAFGAVRMNALEVRTELGSAPLGWALYPRLSAANHSCAPNAELQFADGFTACVVYTGAAHAATAAPPPPSDGAPPTGDSAEAAKPPMRPAFALGADELCISYVSGVVRALPEPMRRQHLIASRWFKCACARCAAERHAARDERPTAELLDERALGAHELSDVDGRAPGAYEHLVRALYREALAAGGRTSGRRYQADAARLRGAKDIGELFAADWFADLVSAWNKSSVGDRENDPLLVLRASGSLLTEELLIREREQRARAAERAGQPPAAWPLVPANVTEAEPQVRRHRARLAGSRILGDILGLRTIACLASLLVPSTAQRLVIRRLLATLGVSCGGGATSGGVRGGAAPPPWWAMAGAFAEASVRAAEAYERVQLVSAAEAAFLEDVHVLDAAARAWSGGRALVDTLRCELMLRPWAWSLLAIADEVAAQQRSQNAV